MKLADCYYFVNSSCLLGAKCSYRHCEEAKRSTVECIFFQTGRCVRKQCKFRHTQIEINQKNIPCTFETKPGGCRRSNCAFFHRKSNNFRSTNSEYCIFETKPGGCRRSNCAFFHRKSSIFRSTNLEHQGFEVPSTTIKSPPNQSVQDINNVPDPSSAPVTPIVTFDEDKESKTEPVSSTTRKMSSDPEKDWEQIKIKEMLLKPDFFSFPVHHRNKVDRKNSFTKATTLGSIENVPSMMASNKCKNPCDEKNQFNKGTVLPNSLGSKRPAGDYINANGKRLKLDTSFGCNKSLH